MLKRFAAYLFGLMFAVFLMGRVSQTNVAAQTSERAREVKAAPAEVIVRLNEQFFNSFLDVVFTRLKAPSFPLSLARSDGRPKPSARVAANFRAANLSHANLSSGNCESVVILERESGGVRTAVKFEEGRVVAPLAFKGTYSVGLLGCVNFQGWADTVITLNFDRQRQTLSARVRVVDIHLSGIPSLASGMVVGLVQNSIDSRINPVEILQAAQLSARLPVTGSNGALRLRATEIRPEVSPGALSLHIFYEFTPTE